MTPKDYPLPEPDLVKHGPGLADRTNYFKTETLIAHCEEYAAALLEQIDRLISGYRRILALSDSEMRDGDEARRIAELMLEPAALSAASLSPAGARSDQQNAALYELLRSSHWTDPDALVVVRARDLQTGTQTYALDRLDAELDAAMQANKPQGNETP